MAGTLASLGLDGRILLGNHGTVDLVLHKETEMVTVRGGDIREESVRPADLGPGPRLRRLQPGAVRRLGGVAQGSRLAGGAALEQVILYHLAVFLWAAGAAPDPAAGLRVARAAP